MVLPNIYKNSRHYKLATSVLSRLTYLAKKGDK
jgi:hypothetical protein